MSAIFDFSSLLTVLLLLICTCAYLRDMRPTIFDGGQVSLPFIRQRSYRIEHQEFFSHALSLFVYWQTLQPGEMRLKRTGVTGFFWKLSRIGERLSPYVGLSCAVMAIHLLFVKWNNYRNTDKKDLNWFIASKLFQISHLSRCSYIPNHSEYLSSIR